MGWRGVGWSGVGVACVYILININRSEFRLRSQWSQGKHSEKKSLGRSTWHVCGESVIVIIL